MNIPVCVILPVWNVNEVIGDHLKELNCWISTVQEVIVVDSESSDETTQWIRKELRHQNLRFFSRPRGLYQAWNFAVQQTDAEYVYFATVGDTLDSLGLQKLYSVAERWSCDLVLTPPKLVNASGQSMKEDWPIHRFIETQPFSEARLLSYTEIFLLACFSDIQGILGSSASNLYRTSTMKRNPFPDDVGHAGDTLWGYRYAMDCRIAMLPEKLAKFVVAPTDLHAMSKRQFCELVNRFITEGLERMSARTEVTAEQQWALAMMRYQQSLFQLRSDTWIEQEKQMIEQARCIAELEKVTAERGHYILELEKFVVASQEAGKRRLDALIETDRAMRALTARIENFKGSVMGRVLEKVGLLKL